MPTLTMRPLPGLLLLLTALTLATSADAESSARIRSRPAPTPASAAARAELFAPRVRRSTQNYLRLRLLELREADLDRARLIIEHRLDIDALLGDPPSTAKDAGRRNNHPPRTY